MNGSLALVGSGEYLPAMATFEQSLIDDGIKNGKRPIYVQIPTAAGQESADRLEYWKQLGKTQADRLGVDSIFLPIFTREDANNPEYATLIHNAALIYMSGGDPHYLAETLMGTPLWDAGCLNSSTVPGVADLTYTEKVTFRPGAGHSPP
jgi:cyanophycinase-like exopeptidase